jgi:predicted ATP-grasp superfamily ATP-dependent carboligase
MKILVSEFITGGGLCGEPLPLSLAKEGQMMLSAIVSDLSDIDNSEIEVTLEPRCSVENLPQNVIKNIHVHIINNNYQESLRRLCRDVDAVWLIAPEPDGFLEEVSWIVTKEETLLIGSSPDVIKLVSSKATTTSYLIDHNIQAIETIMAKEAVDLPQSSSGWIVKPDQGAGCEQVFFCETKDDVESAVTQCEKAIVQPMIEGTPASLSMLCNKGECVVIGYNEQMIEWQENRLRYVGTKVNSLLAHKAQFDQLAKSVSAALPELKGYIGMDMIINDAQVMVVEINPRLTTSYVGLRESIGVNPAELILDIFMKDLLPEVSSSEYKEVVVNV